MKKVRILVIDDDAVACEFLQEALLRAGYEVDAFTSAQDALEEELSRYDILLSDIRMPDIDGLQFLRQVHQIRSGRFFHDHFYGAGDDRKLCRQSPRLFTVDIQEDPLLRGGDHPFPGLHGDLADTLNAPEVELGEVPEDQGKAHRTDDGDMEEPVIGHGVGGDEHPAAMVAPVGNNDIEDVHRLLLPLIHADGDPLLPVYEKRNQRPPDKGKEWPADFARPVHPVHNLASEAEACDIVEVSVTGVSLMVAVADVAEIDRVDMILPDGVKGGFQARRNGHGPAEITTGSVGEKPEDGVLAEGGVFIEEAVDYLVERAVAADADNPVDAFEEVLPGYPCGISRSGGQAGFERTKEVPGHISDPGPLFARRSISRMGIHNKDSLFITQGHLPRPWMVVRKGTVRQT